MNTLIIHPEDPSTDFLKPIYTNAQNKTVITGGMPKRELDQLIKRYQRIIMLGHGCPFGLFSVDQFPNTGGYIIDEVSRFYLRSKKLIAIWCYADQYVWAHGLRGLYTGMFISEEDEARQCGLERVTQDMIDQSNDLFAKVIGRNINENLYTIYKGLVEEYGTLLKTNLVARYNYQRLYYRE